jgi:hypothetical protein
MEIDENLARAELSAAEEALHIMRRKEVWKKVQPEKDDLISGGNSPTNKRGKGRPQ